MMPPPTGGERSTDPLDRGLLVAGVMFFVALYALFYPKTYSILDEQAYLSYALTLARGHLYAEEAGVDSVRTFDSGGHTVPSFGLGTSALMAPAVGVDWRAGFALILLAHLGGFTACCAALRKAGLPGWLSLLYLFHPVAALYSRTAMSDVPTTALMMAGVLAWLEPRPRPLLAGLAWGCMPLFRFAQAPVLAALFTAGVIRDLRDSPRPGPVSLRRAGWLVAGLLPGLAIWIALNIALYGGPLRTPIAWPLSPTYLPENLPRYLLSQNLVYPLGLIIGIFVRSPLRLECALLAPLMLGLYGCFRHLYRGFGSLASLIIGDRFFLPLMPVLIVPYAGVASRLLQRAGRRAPALKVAGVALLMASNALITASHDRVLRRQSAIQSLIYSNTSERDLIVCNYDALEYLFEGLGRRQVAGWRQIAAGLEGPDAPALRRLNTALPGLYLLTTVRGDREDGSAREAETMELFARDRFTVDVVASLDEPRFRFRLFRLSRLSASKSRSEAGAGISGTGIRGRSTTPSPT